MIYLEQVVYAMQLKHYGVQDVEIQKSINELFHLGFKAFDGINLTGTTADAATEQALRNIRSRKG